MTDAVFDKIMSVGGLCPVVSAPVCYVRICSIVRAFFFRLQGCQQNQTLTLALTLALTLNLTLTLSLTTLNP